MEFGKRGSVDTGLYKVSEYKPPLAGKFTGFSFGCVSTQ